MRKILAVLMMLALTCMCALAEPAMLQLDNHIDEDGSYVVQVTDVEDEGWYAEVLSDETVVKLASAETDESAFTARFEPVGDGEATVAVEHFYNAFACDQQFTYDLLVKDGKVQEVTGGSQTANVEDTELDSYLVGAWTAQDAQMTVEKNPAQGWDVEITAADYRFVATVYQDCVSGNLLYDKGKHFESGQEEATVSTGAFAIDETGMTWYGDDEMRFEKAADNH